MVGVARVHERRAEPLRTPVMRPAFELVSTYQEKVRRS